MAEKKLLRKKTIALKDGNLLSLAKVCNSLGNLYIENELYSQAIEEYEIEAKSYNDLNMKLDYGKTHRLIGEAYMSLEDFNRALEHIEIYLKISIAEENKIEEQRAYTTLGRCQLLYGQSLTNKESNKQSLKNAESAFFKSLAITKNLQGKISKLEVLDMQARLYLNIGVTKEHLDEFDDSMNYLKKAIEISQSNNFSELLHKSYITIAMQYSRNSDSIIALRYLNLALDLAKLLRDKTEKICETLLLKSEVLIQSGDFQSAKQVLHKSYKMKSPNSTDHETAERLLKITAALCKAENNLITIDPLDYDGKKKLYEKMGDGSCKLQNYSKAVDYYIKMLEFAELNNETGKDLIPIYLSIAQTYKDNNQYDLALEYLWKEYDFEKDNPKDAFSTLMLIGECYEG